MLFTAALALVFGTLPALAAVENRAPVGAADFFAMEEGEVLEVVAPGTLANDLDPDGDSFIMSNVGGPSNGTLTSAVTSGAFTYEPDPGFTGTDSFIYVLRDQHGLFSEEVTVTIEVLSSFNRAPIGIPDAFLVEEGEVLEVVAPGTLANDLDPDGDSFIMSNVGGPSNGTLTSAVTSGAFTYEPDPGFTGTDSFIYVLRDQHGLFSEEVTVTIEVLPSFNRPPVASGDTYATDEDVPLAVVAPGVLGNDVDPDGDDLTAHVVSTPAHGTIDLAPDGSFLYTPGLDFAGTDSFTYVANDGEADSETATVLITVNPINDDPVVFVSGGGICTGGPPGLPIEPSGSIQLTVADVDDPAEDLVLSAASSNQALVQDSNIVLGGEGAERTLSVQLERQPGTAVVTVEATDPSDAFGSVDVTVVAGTNKDDTLSGTLHADMIFGENGQDTLFGLAGNDLLCGGLGDDSLDGGEGNDSLYGEAGNDALTGGAGADIFSGGRGEDQLSDFNADEGDTTDGSIP